VKIEGHGIMYNVSTLVMTVQASWGSDDAGYASDFVAAIEAATKDGVDVINYR
jgi:hypothetical protein